MEKGLNEAVARYLCYAQAASDGGKEIGLNAVVPGKYGAVLFEEGYWLKEEFLDRALDLIDRSRGKSGFAYYVRYAMDQNGYESVLTYISYRLNGDRKQISFHCPLDYASDGLLHRMRKNTMACFRCHWDHGSSRNNCKELWNLVVEPRED